MAPTTITAIIGAVTGVCGLILGIFNTFVARRDTKPNIRVNLEIKLSEGFGGSSDQMVVLAQNRGRIPVILTSWFLQLPNKKSCSQTDLSLGWGDLPRELAPGANYAFKCDAREFCSRLALRGHPGKVKVTLCFNDAIGGLHRARKPFVLDPERWLKD